MKQQSLFKVDWRHHYCYGGSLRNRARGRTVRALSTKDPIHMVIKSNHRILRRPRTYVLVQRLIQAYSRKFYVKIEQASIQHDHIHLLIRSNRRANFHAFFRVLSGQISQRMTDTFTSKWKGPKIWKYRPFSRVIKGWKAYLVVRHYIQLNEKEARGEVPYRKERLKGLTPEELQSLWN